MVEEYYVPLTELSATEINEYKKNLELLLEGNLDGLRGVLDVLGNSRPIHTQGRVFPWAKEIIDAYRNVGRAFKDALKSYKLEEIGGLKKYENLLSGDEDDDLSERILITLKDLSNISENYGEILEQYEGDTFIKKLYSALIDKTEEVDNLKEQLEKLEEFENSF